MPKLVDEGRNAPVVTTDALKIFISYSRKDEEFAQGLLSGLKVGGFEPYLDKHDIAAGEDWAARTRDCPGFR